MAEQLEPMALSVDRYRLMVNAIHDYAIFMLDPSGIISSWNPGAERFKGYTEAEILGSHFSRFYTEKDKAAGVPGRALRAAQLEGRFESEGWRVRKDGSTFWANVVIDPIFGADKQLLGFVKITRDLTEKRAAERALRESEDRFRWLVQGVTDYAIYMLDRSGTVTNWNQGAQRIKGYAPTEIIGRHFSQFYTEEDRERGEPQRALETAESNGKFEKEGWRLRKDGSRFWAHVVIDPIKDDEGKIIGFAKVTRDMTERKLADKALEDAREALFQSQKIEAIGKLTGGIAHDFNNLLSAVLGSLELIGKRVHEPRLLGLVSNALEGVRRGISLTQRMLAFARKQELNPKALDAPALVRGMTDLLQRSLGPMIMLEMRFGHGAPPVFADPNQLELAILNLSLNARDAMPAGGSIVIEAHDEIVADRHETRLQPGRYVRLSINDTGEGMDEATLARAMEPFFTTKGPGKGTGLGLSMVHGMAEQLSGRLFLKTKKGTGTTAELWLPVADRAAAIGMEGSVEPVHPNNSERQLVILAVDDDPLILMNTTALLEDLGHFVIEANSGEQALQSLRSGSVVDLMITDHAMPRMTGSELAEQIKLNQPDLPIILATGYAELPPGGAQNLPRLNKPYSQADLARAIAAVIGNKGSWAP